MVGSEGDSRRLDVAQLTSMISCQDSLVSCDLASVDRTEQASKGDQDRFA